jgi:hypothetical protein
MAKLYNPPFVYDDGTQTIYCDGTPHQVMDVDNLIMEEEDGAALAMIRGWGGLRKAYGEHTAALVQDAFGRRVAQLLNEHGVGEEVIAAMQGKQVQL